MYWHVHTWCMLQKKLVFAFGCDTPCENIINARSFEDCIGLHHQASYSESPFYLYIFHTYRPWWLYLWEVINGVTVGEVKRRAVTSLCYLSHIVWEASSLSVIFYVSQLFLYLSVHVDKPYQFLNLINPGYIWKAVLIAFHEKTFCVGHRQWLLYFYQYLACPNGLL